MHEHKVVPVEEARQALGRKKRQRQLRGGGAAQPRTVRQGRRRRHVPYILLAAVVALAAVGLVWLTPMSGTAPTIGGRDYLVVVTGSMSPAINTGDMVAVRPVRAGAVREGDIITFRDAAQPHILITHRVFSVAAGETGPVFFTKGDANPIPDLLPVAPSQLIGRVELTVPFAGYIVNFLRSPLGVFSLILVPGGLLIVYGLRLLSGPRRESEMA